MGGRTHKGGRTRSRCSPKETGTEVRVRVSDMVGVGNDREMGKMERWYEGRKGMVCMQSLTGWGGDFIGQRARSF